MDIAVIDETKARYRVEIARWRLIAPHQPGMLADRGGAEPRPDAGRMKAAIERDAEHRRPARLQIPRGGHTHKSAYRRHRRVRAHVPASSTASRVILAPQANANGAFATARA
ncbi:MAG TPA: hypothetical protein VGI28_13090 [Stellaceae bacterium]